MKTTEKEKLARLIENCVYANREFEYFRGVRSARGNKPAAVVDQEKCLIDYAAEADRAEKELFDYLETL